VTPDFALLQLELKASEAFPIAIKINTGNEIISAWQSALRDNSCPLTISQQVSFLSRDVL
jgi:hypothetical protein